MTIAAQLKQLREALAAWARGNGGVIVVASDLDDMVTLLRETPGAARTIVMFHREEKRGEYEEAGMVDRYFWVTLARNKGLKLEAGANLVAGSAGGKPLFNLVEEAREIIRAQSWDTDTTEQTSNYRSAEPLTVNGTTLTDVQRLEFSIGTRLPAVDLTRNPTDPDEETSPPS